MQPIEPRLPRGAADLRLICGVRLAIPFTCATNVEPRKTLILKENFELRAMGMSTAKSAARPLLNLKPDFFARSRNAIPRTGTGRLHLSAPK